MDPIYPSFSSAVPVLCGLKIFVPVSRIICFGDASSSRHKNTTIMSMSPNMLSVTQWREPTDQPLTKSKE